MSVHHFPVRVCCEDTDFSGNVDHAAYLPTAAAFQDTALRVPQGVVGLRASLFEEDEDKP